MTTSPVGMRCPECARHTTPVRTIRQVRPTGYQVTLAVIAINVAAFLGEGGGAFTFTGSPGSSWLLSHGWLAAYYIKVHHDYWRLLTSGFLHADLLHILSNMYVLYWVGRLLEPAIGRARFIGTYFAGLCAGSYGVIIASPNVVTIGASGAIFGLLGAAFTEAQRRGVDQVRNQLVILIVFNLILTLSLPGISIGAHVGGLIGGGLATLGFNQGDRMRSQAVGWAACIAIIVVSIGAAIYLADHTKLPF